MNLGDGNIAILEEVYKQLKQILSQNKDIILIDRSINDRQIWNYQRFLRGDMSNDLYYINREKYSKLSKELIDFLIITYANPLISLKRDYLSSLALEQRSFLNEQNIEEFNNSLNALQNLFLESVDNMILLDTSNMEINDVSTTIASQIMPVMRKKYIDSFKKKYNLK